MKIAKYIFQGKVGIGLVKNNRMVDLSFLGENLRSAIPQIMKQSESELIKVGEDLCALEEVEYLAPLDDSAKFIIVGWNYLSHAQETNKDIPKDPVVLARWADSIVGHGASVVRPSSSETLDYEGELAVVIGKPGRRISIEDAQDHIFGFTCCMEGSVREYQRISPTAGKNFYHSGALGPWIVKAADFNYKTQTITTRVNGERRQEISAGQMIFDIPRLISHISEFTVLNAGDVIATGTPDGVGSKMKPPQWLKAGDTVDIHISGIGSLTNTVAQEA